MENLKLEFTCTDRLKETQNLELDILDGSNIAEENNVKEYNRILIEKLGTFQTSINSLMTKFVEKEADAISKKTLSNEHLKKASNKKSDSESEESGSEDEAEGEVEKKVAKRNSEDNSKTKDEQPEDKKPCLTSE